MKAGALIVFALLAVAAESAFGGVPDRIVYHSRVAPAAMRSGRVALVWADSIRFEVEVPPSGADSPDYGFDAAYSYFRGDSAIATGTFSDHYPAARAGMSLKFILEDGRAYVEAGATTAKVTLPVQFDAVTDSIFLENPDGLRLVGQSCLTDTIAAPRFAPFGSVAALVEAVEASSDPATALWSYLDRNTNHRRAMPGGNYRLATIPDGDGGYWVVYLGGATVNADLWEPLRIKGHLVKTPFSNHYDLEWLGATGRAVSSEAYATLDPSTGILTLSFPLHNSELRFRKANLR